MNPRPQRIQVPILLIWFALVSHALAVPIFVADRASLGGDDFLDWGAALGPEATGLSNPLPPLLSDGGLGVTVSSTLVGPNGFERVDQGSNWNGNFAAGEAALFTGATSGTFAPVLTIEFGAPVFGAGLQIQTEHFGNPLVDTYRADIEAFDASGNSLFFFRSNDGMTNDAGDGSALFIGVLDSTASISSIQVTALNFRVFNPDGFAVNRLDIVRSAAAVPESSPYIVFIALLSLAGFHRLSRRERPGS